MSTMTLSAPAGIRTNRGFWGLLWALYTTQFIGAAFLSTGLVGILRDGGTVRLVGFGMGGWFLSTGIGNNLSGIFASSVSGEGGMTVASAQHAYTMGFWILTGFGVALFLIAPIIVVIPLSFNAEPYFTFTEKMLSFDPEGYSTRWYESLLTFGMQNPDSSGWAFWSDAWANAKWVQAAKNSIIIGVFSTILATPSIPVPRIHAGLRLLNMSTTRPPAASAR